MLEMALHVILKLIDKVLHSGVIIITNKYNNLDVTVMVSYYIYVIYQMDIIIVVIVKLFQKSIVVIVDMGL